MREEYDIRKGVSVVVVVEGVWVEDEWQLCGSVEDWWRGSFLAFGYKENEK